MYSKVKIFGHPLHPMLIAYPIALYTVTLVAFVIAQIGGDLFWFKVAVAANVAGAAMAVVAAIPGFVDWGIGIPNTSPGKRHGLRHMLFNLVALVLFVLNAGVHVPQWNAVNPDRGWGVTLSILGMLCTFVAGFIGWTLTQTDHVGIELSTEQQRMDSTRLRHTRLRG